MRRLMMGLALAALTALPAALAAQQDPGARSADATLREMAARPSAAERDRATVASFLRRTDVRRAAEEHGIDARALQDGVATIGDAAAAQLAHRIRSEDDQAAHVGGDTFVISSTAVIVALLVIILIEVS